MRGQKWVKESYGLTKETKDAILKEGRSLAAAYPGALIVIEPAPFIGQRVTPAAIISVNGVIKSTVYHIRREDRGI